MSSQYAQRILAAILAAIGLAVGLNLVVSPFYDPDPVWDVLNWFMAVGCFAMIGIAIHKRLNRVAVYGAIVLLVLFLWLWFADFQDVDTDFSWTWVNVLYLTMALETARSLWPSESD